MRNRIGCLAALALLLSMPAFAQGLDPDPAAPPADDPFAAGAFEAQAGTSVPPSGAGVPAAGVSAEAARTEYLVGGSALVSAQGYAPIAMDGYAAAASLEGKAFAKVTVPDYGSLYLSYGIAQPFFAGLAGSGPSLAAPPVDLSSPTYVMPELHYSFDVGKKVFLRLGKQLLAWGPSRVWSPVDFVNSSHADFFAPIDLRQGKPGARLHVPMGSYNAFLFADFSADASPTGVSDPASATLLDARLDGTMGGFELGLTGMVGSHVQDRGGFDFSGDFLGTAVYGELAFAPPYSGYDGWAMASLGFSRSLGDLKRWTISGEGFYNSRGSDLTGNYAAMAADPLYGGEWYAYAALSAKELFSAYLATVGSALANFSDRSYSLKLEEDFAFPGSVPFSLALAFAGGGAGKELTFVGGNDSLSITAQTRIDF
jgi:hypothetical protein